MAFLLAFVIKHVNPKFVASPVGLCGCMVFCSGGDGLSERPHGKGIALYLSRMFVIAVTQMIKCIRQMYQVSQPL